MAIYSRKSALGMIDQCHSETDLVNYVYVGQWPIFHGPLILPFIIVIDFKIFYNLKMAPAGGYSGPSGDLLQFLINCHLKWRFCASQIIIITNFVAVSSFCKKEGWLLLLNGH